LNLKAFQALLRASDVPSCGTVLCLLV